MVEHMNIEGRCCIWMVHRKKTGYWRKQGGRLWQTKLVRWSLVSVVLLVCGAARCWWFQQVEMARAISWHPAWPKLCHATCILSRRASLSQLVPYDSECYSLAGQGPAQTRRLYIQLLKVSLSVVQSSQACRAGRTDWPIHPCLQTLLIKQ